MTEHLHPATVADLALAPVLLSIERNLAALRSAADLSYTLALELNDSDSRYRTPAERAGRLQRCAVRFVDLHGWDVRPTDDLHGLAVTHGQFTVPIMLGKRLVDYVGA
jgi:hypothetical protein